MTKVWKHILLHLLFWVLYIIIWGIRDSAYAPTYWDTIDSNLIVSAVFAIGVVVNLYVLIPFILLKRKRTLYIFLVVVLMMTMGFGTSKALAFYFVSIDTSTSLFFGGVSGLATAAGDFLVVYGLTTCLYFINEWYIKERRLRELEAQNLKAELSLLKGQINPHFLFNALNSVHVLIRKNPVKAQETLERFSDLLSHQIYEVNKEEVPLADEVENLSNYVAIQKMRFGEQTSVNWQIRGNLNGQKVAPMLFLNFVENAFKYGESPTDDPVKIDILLRADHHALTFSCVNSVNGPAKNNGKLGVGIAYVKRRLEILYPNQYSLDIEAGAENYSVNLELKLNEN